MKQKSWVFVFSHFMPSVNYELCFLFCIGIFLYAEGKKLSVNMMYIHWRYDHVKKPLGAPRDCRLCRFLTSNSLFTKKKNILRSYIMDNGKEISLFHNYHDWHTDHSS